MRIILLVVFMFTAGHSFAGVEDKTSQCLRELAKDARFSPISNHLALDGQGVTKLQMLTDPTRPDERQKQAIANWIDARSQCVNLSPNKISVDLHILFLSIVPDLYNGQTTFGEFNKKWQALFNETINTSIKPHDNTVIHQH